MIPVDPLTATIGFLAWMAFRKQANSNYGQLTPERDEVFRNAMQFLKDPARMNTLAEEFQKEGLKFQAHLLRKRALWRSRTPDVQAEHDAIFKKAMESENIKAVLEVAKAFEEMTATAKAKELRDHATAVHQAAIKKKEDEKTVAVNSLRDTRRGEKEVKPVENEKKNGVTAEVISKAEALSEKPVIDTSGE